MTPFHENIRAATISLSKQEEEFVRAHQRTFDTPFNIVITNKVLDKLKDSLELSDILRGPVGHMIKDEIPINLDLLT